MPDFTVDPAAQPSACRTSTPASVAGEVDYFDPDFKYPQNFRASLGFDQRLPGGFILTLDGYYAKQVNQIYLQDTNIPQDPTLNGEGRAVYGTFAAATGRATTSRLTTAVTSAVFHTNTSAGETFAGTIQVQKAFANRFSLNAAYTASRTTDQISATSSQAFSNYQFASIGDGTIADRSVTTSFFDVPSKVTLTGTVDLPLGFDFSVFYTGFSGTPYGWVINSGPAGTNGDANADGIAGNDLVFVPADPSQISLSNPAAYDSLQNFISSQKCLAAARGSHARAELLPQPVAELLQPADRLDHAAGEGLGHRAHARHLQLPELPEQRLGPDQAGERVRGGAGVPERGGLRHGQRPADLPLHAAGGGGADGIWPDTVALDDAARGEVAVRVLGREDVRT